MSAQAALRPEVASAPALPALECPPMLMPTATLPQATPLTQRLAGPTRLLVVVLAHALLFATIASHMATEAPRPPATIEVALIAPPAPAPTSPPKVETPPRPAEPPKPVAPPKPVEPPKPVVKKAAPKPAPRPKPAQAITEPTPEPTPAPQSEPVAAPAPATPSPPAAPISASPGPAVAAPAPMVDARFDAAYLNNPRPAYPRLSRRMGEQGKVLLRVHVDADGKALEVRLQQSSGHKRLDEAARAAIAQWRFVPARRGDEAVATWVIVPIEFKLEDA